MTHRVASDGNPRSFSNRSRSESSSSGIDDRDSFIVRISLFEWRYMIFMTMSLTDKIRLSIHRIAEPLKRFLQPKSIMSKEQVTRQQALEWCQNFLCGAWSTIDVEQLQMDPVLGGLSNYLYCCSLPDNVELQSNEPRKVMLRIYGEAHQKHRGTLLIDSVVCTLLSERKLGPRVHGIFPKGRLEEFVEAESLVVSEIRDPDVSRSIARLLGELHQIDMPLVKEPIWLYHTIERHLTDLPTDISKFRNDSDRTIFKELQAACNFPKEFEELKTLLSTVDSRVCFTHNDFQPGNILRVKSETDTFTVIDFEYCSYNYRGFDIGNHFCEFMFDYKGATEWPLFRADFTRYPNEEQQMNFTRSYADVIMSNKENSAEPSVSDRDELARQIMKEANYYALASNFFWALWAINMATSTTISFGYMEYARARLTAYHLTRDLMTGADGHLPPQMTEEILRSARNPFQQSYIAATKPPTS